MLMTNMSPNGYRHRLAAQSTLNRVMQPWEWKGKLHGHVGLIVKTIVAQRGHWLMAELMSAFFVLGDLIPLRIALL